MKTITHNLAEKGKSDIHLYYLADFHIGDPHSDYKLIREILDRILADPDAYCILGGDIINAATKNSVSDVYSESMTPGEQIKFCIKLFEPLAKAGRILGILEGNHEQRIYKTDGILAMEMLAINLDLASVYSSDVLAINIKTGKNKKGRPISYLCFCCHGSGGGKKVGGKANSMVDRGNLIDADLIFTAHTHQPLVVKQDFIRWNPQNGTLSQIEKCFVNTSAMLSGYGGYGAVYGFQPPSNAVPMVTLSGTERKITATM